MNKSGTMKIYFSGILVVVLAIATSVAAQSTPTDLTVAEQRQIIESLIREKFDRAPQKTILISTANLHEDLIKDFPTPKNKKVEFVNPEKAREENVCAYEFGSFEAIGLFISVTFGDCHDGLAYDFRKYGEKWKSVGLKVQQ